jgi:hypothetical protein
METALEASTFGEARCYLMVTPCPACGKGPWQYDPPPSPQAGEVVTIDATCGQCGAAKRFAFRVERYTQPWGAQQESINPTNEPSRIVDLAGWMGLFYLLLESAAAEPSPPASRRLSYRAALCLREALKFYGDDELPPPSAFFTDRGQDAFRQHPHKFARQRLIDMRARLPAISAMGRRVDRDDRVARRKWWQFWRY